LQALGDFINPVIQSSSITHLLSPLLIYILRVGNKETDLALDRFAKLCLLLVEYGGFQPGYACLLYSTPEAKSKLLEPLLCQIVVIV
jgi:hypothetical protein